MDWLGVGLPVWPAHPFGNVVVLKHVFPPMPCSLEMIENQLRHSWMVNIFNLNSCHVIVGWGYLSQMQRRLHLSNLNYCDLGCKGKTWKNSKKKMLENHVSWEVQLSCFLFLAPVLPKVGPPKHWTIPSFPPSLVAEVWGSPGATA